jgi:hypothetical protein
MKGISTMAAAVAVVGFAWGCGGGAQTDPGPAKAPEPAKAPAAEAKAPAPAPAAAPVPAGAIVIEAENPKANVKAGTLAWVPVTKPAGFSGAGALKAMPNDDNVNNDNDYTKDSPRLDYEVDFPKAGTWRVWVRGCGETQEDNSCHVGLDGKECETSDRIAEFEEDWTWCNDTKDGDPAEIKVAAPGKHILNVWMREDGFVIDKILLTQDPKLVPTGK